MTHLNEQTSVFEKATFSMGCFWGPDSLFGSLQGVTQTEVGYAGGTSVDPTYRKMGDHSETVDITFNPEIISYEHLVRLFWESHDATKDRFYKERQYISILFYRNEDQYEAAKKVHLELEQVQGKEIQTEFQCFTHFYKAEDYHQKYFLRRFKGATEAIKNLFPDEASFIHSTLAARLNGFVRERGQLPDIKKEITHWGLTEADTELLLETIDKIRW
ncbi:peptide-methionine (S)-S-oxide reductase MsrA [Desemzia sp. RIT804]|uniref:peptide-methionine (S)-S-oxide reductase MsrA n=1 Tax=Desemzia sp. RIT 804 TaxID=2810209 RepID=UPI00194EA031|nr:peptide-methionine (S)-S-oxide reductase MsrA [Desemzia sp. RIT 804]MBM6615562.1 peptide-methionine (S)-S-oxide reductase MsrA [Desemzia sp. RIT 804]